MDDDIANLSRGCIEYRQSLDRQNPEAPRVAQEFHD